MERTLNGAGGDDDRLAMAEEQCTEAAEETTRRDGQESFDGGGGDDERLAAADAQHDEAA